jgi:energy-coupling factor transporter ATP-binding protein EcfA2
LLELSAGLLGLATSEAAREVQHVLQQLQLVPLRQQKLDRLSTLQGRIVALAHALLGSPRHLAVEDPLLGLTTQDSRQFLDVLNQARQGRSLIVHVPHAAAGCMERLLVDSCEEVLVLERGAITLQGPPSQLDAGRGLFQITVLGEGVADDGQTLRGALAERGVVVRAFTPLPQAASTGSQTQGPVARLVVELDPVSTTLPLFAAAKSCNSTLLDLHALSTLE